ncbi:MULTISPECIES: hypothetical protein [unclassified Frankia]|uniref:hypothetical protein n=1 Tax=unclassified Frankia TaxID=2632575 RepID=UPI0013652049|nr:MULTISPECIES: hypothetical protein [unclassified Frankia]
MAVTSALEGWHGSLTRDDTPASTRVPTLAGVQLRCAHLIRSLRGVQTAALGAEK